MPSSLIRLWSESLNAYVFLRADTVVALYGRRGNLSGCEVEYEAGGALHRVDVALSAESVQALIDKARLEDG